MSEVINPFDALIAARRHVAELESENARLRAALEEYAKTGHWGAIQIGAKCTDWVGSDEHGWELAQRTLRTKDLFPKTI